MTLPYRRSTGGPPFLQGVGLEGKRYIVMQGFSVVGWTDLETPMEDDVHAAGVLEAGPQYHLVKGIFDVYRQTSEGDLVGMKKFISMRDALGLTIYENSSLPLAASIQLISEWSNGIKMIHVAITDERYWLRFRIQDGPKLS